MSTTTKAHIHQDNTTTQPTNISGPVYYCSVLLPENTNARILSPIEKQHSINLAERVAKTEAISQQPAAQSKEDFYIVSLPRGVHRIPIVNLSKEKAQQNLYNHSVCQSLESPESIYQNTLTTEPANEYATVFSKPLPASFYLVSPPLDPSHPNTALKINTSAPPLETQTPLYSPVSSVSYVPHKPEPLKLNFSLGPHSPVPISPLCPPPHLLRERRISRAASVPDSAHPLSQRKEGQAPPTPTKSIRQRPKSMLSRISVTESPESLPLHQKQWLDIMDQKIKMQFDTSLEPCLDRAENLKEEARQFWDEQRRAMDAFGENLMKKMILQLDSPVRDSNLSMNSLLKNQISLEEEVNVAQREIINLQQKMVDYYLLKPLHAELEAHCEVLEAQIVHFRKESQELKSCQTQVKELQERLASLSKITESDKTKRILENVTAEALHWKTGYESQIKINHSLEEKIDALKKEVSSQQQKLSYMDIRNQSLESDLIYHQKEIEQLRTKSETPKTENSCAMEMAGCEEEIEQRSIENRTSITTTAATITLTDGDNRILWSGMSLKQIIATIEELEQENRRIQQCEDVNRIQLEYMQKELNRQSTTAMKRSLERKDTEIYRLKKSLEQSQKKQNTTNNSISQNYSPCSSYCQTPSEEYPEYSKNYLTKNGHLSFMTQINGQLSPFSIRLPLHDKNQYAQKQMNSQAMSWQAYE
ncbi:hypothetical protein BDF14DRAFT_1796506 [Spinellus fusiger]|nr:hypothetical protein BDF14DRAFT_1796506 [Spinellus fusiger]